MHILLCIISCHRFISCSDAVGLYLTHVWSWRYCLIQWSRSNCHLKLLGIEISIFFAIRGNCERFQNTLNENQFFQALIPTRQRITKKMQKMEVIFEAWVIPLPQMSWKRPFRNCSFWDDLHFDTLDICWGR